MPGRNTRSIHIVHPSSLRAKAKVLPVAPKSLDDLTLPSLTSPPPACLLPLLLPYQPLVVPSHDRHSPVPLHLGTLLFGFLFPPAATSFPFSPLSSLDSDVTFSLRPPSTALFKIEAPRGDSLPHSLLCFSPST